MCSIFKNIEIYIIWLYCGYDYAYFWLPGSCYSIHYQMSNEDENQLLQKILQKNYQVMVLENEIEEIYYELYSNPVSLKALLKNYKLVHPGSCTEYTLIFLDDNVDINLMDALSKSIYYKPCIFDWMTTNFEPICLLGHVYFNENEKKILNLYNLQWSHKRCRTISSNLKV